MVQTVLHARYLISLIDLISFTVLTIVRQQDSKVDSPRPKNDQQDTSAPTTPPSPMNDTTALLNRPLTPQSTVILRRSRSAESAASPSSSKVKVEDLPPSAVASAPRQMPGRHNGSERPEILFPFMPHHYPPIMMPNFPPNLPHPPSHLLTRESNGSAPSMNDTRYISPSGPKSLAYVPTISYSNPLSIRPAGTMYWPGERYVPASTPSPPVQASIPKKPLPIGSDWPYNRQANGSTPKPARQLSMSTSTASPTPRPAPHSSAIPPSLASPSTPTLPTNSTINAASVTQFNSTRSGQNSYPGKSLINCMFRTHCAVTLRTVATSFSLVVVMVMIVESFDSPSLLFPVPQAQNGSSMPWVQTNGPEQTRMPDVPHNLSIPPLSQDETSSGE